MSFPFRNITICYWKNEVSIIFVSTKKNYIHKILALDTTSDQAAEVIEVIFLYEMNVRNWRHSGKKTTIQYISSDLEGVP